MYMTIHVCYGAGLALYMYIFLLALQGSIKSYPCSAWLEFVHQPTCICINFVDSQLQEITCTQHCNVPLRRGWTLDLDFEASLTKEAGYGFLPAMSSNPISTNYYRAFLIIAVFIFASFVIERLQWTGPKLKCKSSNRRIIVFLYHRE